jgi:2-amino-4-hydroxy-6-hydroxymethyldihydropteridine diphosphokinase
MTNNTLHTLVLLIGGNMGNRLDFLAQATNKISQQVGVITCASSCYETRAWGLAGQPDFLNQVLVCSTSKNAYESLNACLIIEKELGRNRIEKWGSRTIDIDILYFDQEIIATEDLKIPHPYLHERRFTLVPLVEVMPDYVHPVFNVTNKQLLERCADELQVTLLNSK